MKHSKVTQKEFDKMKLLQKAGLKRKDIIAFTGRLRTKTREGFLSS